MYSTETAWVKAILVSKYTNAIIPNTTIHLLNAADTSATSDSAGNIEFRVIVDYGIHSSIEVTIAEDDYSFIDPHIDYKKSTVGKTEVLVKD
jgi:hypothetical protein